MGQVETKNKGWSLDQLHKYLRSYCKCRMGSIGTREGLISVTIEEIYISKTNHIIIIL